MKKTASMFLKALFMFVFIEASAQTITLTPSNGSPTSYNLNSNQVITINSFLSGSSINGEAWVKFRNGREVSIRPYEYGLNKTSSGSGSGVAFTGNAVFTGVTNITVYHYSVEGTTALTLTIASQPSTQAMIPQNTVVIPSDATGPVQIVLESSSDLVNWTTSLPGTYGNTHSNRFFRVRAIAQ